MLLVAFAVVEQRAAEPILPLELFRNRTFSVTSAIGFVVGFALFGAITYLPLYLQIVKAHSPTESGLLLTPMMAGVLVTSIGSGQLISKLGRYKPFPIVGTALMTVAMYLLSGLSVEMPVWQTAGYMLAARLRTRDDDAGARARGPERRPVRAARRRDVRLDALPTGGRLDRRLDLRRDLRQPARRQPRSTRCRRAPRSPLRARRSSTQLPPALHSVYLDAFAAALGPVFAVAAAVSLVAFLLTWLLREVPLRKSAAAECIAESFATPRDAESLPELERILATLARRENRWRVYEEAAEHAGVELDPTELWILARLGEKAAIDLTDPQLAAAGASLRERGLVEDSRLVGKGEAVYGRVLAMRRRRLAELLDGWAPEDHDEVRAMLDAFAREFVAEPPVTA